MKKKLIAMLSAAVISLSLIPGTNALATAPMNSSTSSNAKMESKNLIPEVKTTPLSDAEAAEVLKAATEKAKDLKSMDINGVIDVDANGTTMSFKGNASMDIANKAFLFSANFMGQEMKGIVKDGMQYTYSNNQWTSSKLDPKTFEGFEKAVAQPAMDNESFLKYFEAGRAEDGTIVFKNKEKLTGKVLSDLMAKQMEGTSSNAGQINDMAKELEKANLAIDTQITYDKDNNLKKIVVATVMEQNSQPMNILLTLDVANINSIKEIQVPEEAKNASQSTETTKAN